MTQTDRELSIEQLRHKTDPTTLGFESTAELETQPRIIGQDRAVRAIDFGIEMPNAGYNIYAVGPSGTGRTTAVRTFLLERAGERPVPDDWLYVYNFDEAHRPKAISLPAGKASAFQRQMSELVQQIRSELPRAFEGEHYEQRRREIMLEMQQRQQALYQALEEHLNRRGFALIRNQFGLNIAPMINNEPLSGEDYQKLDPELKKKFEDFRPELQEQFDKTMRQARELDREVRNRIERINDELAGFVLDNLMTELREELGEHAKIGAYLAAVKQDVIQNVARFMPGSDEGSQSNPVLDAARTERWFNRYEVNVLTEGTSCDCAPVVAEDNPTYHNLIGRIEHRAEFGAMVTDFGQIRAGALHRANGGYLMLDAKNLFANMASWEALKRALSNHEIKIEEIAQLYGIIATVSLEPEPIPLDVKVVIIGDERTYQLLYAYDEDFRELFKVKAQFVTQVRREDEIVRDYAHFVGTLCRREGLSHFGADAVARLLDEAARMADDQEKITTRFAGVADLVREAAFWATKHGHALVTAEDVRQAVDEQLGRVDYAAEQYVQTIQDGVILIETTGGVVGQVNGLSVVQVSNHAFGLPSRITAKTFMGRAGVVSIDRMVKMSGPIHDKGQLILASYLSSRFAQDEPLSVSASLTFEQLYSGVEGDSASSTELYALLSALAGVPIKQNIAVTGSVNQSGQVQAIGGVNAKIQGFFDVCRANGLTGDQGVMVPASNVRHLMLRDEVTEAVARGEFHIYAVETIEQGIEVLTGVAAGEVDEEGNYPEGSIYAAVQAKLAEYAHKLRNLGKKAKGAEDALATNQAEDEGDETPGDEIPPEPIPEITP